MPKDLLPNLSFRRDLIKQGFSDPEAAHDLAVMCSRDLLFYINSFVWAYDPREAEGRRVMPFITFTGQDRILEELFCGITEGHDVGVEKSRDMGLTWLCLLAFEHQWHFRDLVSFMLLSRKERLVDATEDPDSLFWRLDFIHKKTPNWLLPTIQRSKLHMFNVSNGSMMDGEATTGDMTRGGKRTGTLLDEFASVLDGYAALSATRDATRCRVFNSTHKGQGTAHYDIMQRPKMVRITYHWTQSPAKRAGAYLWREVEGSPEELELVKLDPSYTYPPDFEFVKDIPGKVRSPYYDIECDRAAHPMEIAQELDIDTLGSDYQFFDQATLDKIESEVVMPPFSIGDMDFDRLTMQVAGFVDKGRGPMTLWVLTDPNGRLLGKDEYVVGADVSAGTGASNSCLSVAKRGTGEKIAEWADPNIPPDRFAQMAVAVAKWANNALLIWEANGPGRIFGDRVVELGYENIYLRSREGRLTRKILPIPGWHSTVETKLALLGDYRRVLGVEFINRSKAAIAECRQYVFLSSGRVEHTRQAHTPDPSGARANHGDRVIADALCWRGMKEAGKLDRPKGREPTHPCLATRRAARQARNRTFEAW